MARASASSGTSRVITEPEPVIAPAPMVTGATSAVFDPMKAPWPTTVSAPAGQQVALAAVAGEEGVDELVGEGAGPPAAGGGYGRQSAKRTGRPAGGPSSSPSRITIRPRITVTMGQPVTSRPS